MTRKTSSTTTGASPSDGSSNSSRSGLVMSARAMVSICCSPPLRRFPLFLRRSASLGKTSNTFSSVHGSFLPAGAGRHLEVLDHRQRLEDEPALRDEADAQPGDLVRGQPHQLRAVELDAALAGAA